MTAMSDLGSYLHFLSLPMQTGWGDLSTLTFAASSESSLSLFVLVTSACKAEGGKNEGAFMLRDWWELGCALL